MKSHVHVYIAVKTHGIIMAISPKGQSRENSAGMEPPVEMKGPCLSCTGVSRTAPIDLRGAQIAPTSPRVW